MGGSGGGASGAISYPGYMQDLHALWLSNADIDVPDLSLVAAMNAATGNSPFAGAVAFDPDVNITAIDSVLTTLNGIVASFNHTADFNSAVVTARAKFTKPIITADTATLDTTTLDSITVTDDDIEQDMQALDAVLTEQLESNELLKFRAGLLNIGAVNSSAYSVGEAILRGMKDRTVAQHGSQLRVQLNTQARDINAKHALSFRALEAQHKVKFREIEAAHKKVFKEIDSRNYISTEEIVRMSTDMILQQAIRDANLIHNFTHLFIEARRICSVLKKEEIEEQLNIDEADGKWDIELFRHAGNLLASVTGGVAQANDKKSKAVSAIGGALSMAATGAMVGGTVTSWAGPAALIGAGVGAVVGAGMGLLSAQ